MSEPKIYPFDNDDPAMRRAYQSARETFRYFWREIAWERRRIVPALDLACVKAPFSDVEEGVVELADVEHMWLSEVDFDGQQVSGVLLNSPNNLTSVKEGDSASIPIRDISDWMYVIGGQVFGAYTVNLIRSRLSRKERQDHDGAWGFDFGDAKTIRVAPDSNKGGGLLSKWFGKRSAESDEHPMSESMAASLVRQLATDPSLASKADKRGWTLLHHEALAGSTPAVKVLLAAGANPIAKNEQGKTPIHLARSLGWDKVVALLRNA